MSASLRIPEEVLARQREASNPSVSAWVSANAGAGKTFVLAQRVIRLLLEGTDPAKILCLTFTKAAAANMANRVFDELRKWIALDGAALDAALRGIGVSSIDAARRIRARRLFAEALDTPGGLKVQTIHAFCTRLLHQFPFEANVSACFTVLDERTERELLDRATLAVLLDAAARPDSSLGRALATATAAVGDATFKQVVGEAIRLRDKLLAWVSAAGGIAAAIEELGSSLGITAQETSESLEREMTNGPLFPATEWPTLANIFRQGSKTDVDKANSLDTAVRSTGAERTKTYLDVFFTGTGGPRQRLTTKTIDDANPGLRDRLLAEQTRLASLLERTRAATCRDRTAALLEICTEVIARYRAEKNDRGALDYDDLIDRTLDLLERVEAAWVHYKLDLGIDHVLIDEAQDTSPKQWQIIKRLVVEFASGEGARGALRRSIFAVGDEKQSIFSFQGAAPAAFSQERREFKGEFDAGGLTFLPIEFKYSFRSVQVVLEAVDEVFKRPQAFEGLTADPVPTVHAAVRSQAPGHVEVWPLVEPQERPPVAPWDAPFDTSMEASPRVRLARKIAKSVKTWIDRRDPVGDGNERHPVQPGDILILVRQRGPLFEAIIRALKYAGIAVAGADRLVLTEHIAVMDLMALADALLLPDDDLALASVLKSPLFGLGDDQLFTLAWGRRGSLRAALRAHAADDRQFAEVSAKLDRFADWARSETPFGFYARVLGPERGRAKMLARLGPEAADALDEFLELALDDERRETPSLQGFVASLRAAAIEIKRDMDIARNEVRVMTVHGAKGLEAPIVVLADTTTPPEGPPQRQPRILALPATNAPPGTPDRLVWSARRNGDVTVIANARASAQAAAEDEHRRLLYVAMTRAADRLVVCGAVGEREKPTGCWYDLVYAALKPPLSVEQPADDGDGVVWRWRKGVPEDAAVGAAAAATLATATVPPPWLAQPATAESPRTISIAPSAALDDLAVGRTVRTGADADIRSALARGRLVHRLVQSLPDVPPERRAEAGRKFLAGGGKEFSEPDREQMLAQVLGLIIDPRFVSLFAPGSRAEVPIVGRLPGRNKTPLVVAGQIDRLAVTPDAVLIADYKTNRPAPRTLAEVPAAYVTQLALYRAVLQKLYPGRIVRAALVWTEVPDLMELSEAMLDRALAQLTSA